MHTPLQHARPPLRRRSLSAAGIALFLGGLVFGMAIEASAGETDRDAIEAAAPDGIAAAMRMASFEFASDRAIADDLAFLSSEFDGVADFTGPDGVSLERRAIWNRVADCESGNWQRSRPIDGSRRWDYGLSFDHGDIFEGGLNFHPRTWDAFRDADMPDHAGNATSLEQMIVGERVLAEQGWKAWPVCSRKLGLR